MCGRGEGTLWVPDKCASFLSSPACGDKPLSITRPSHTAKGPTDKHGLDSVPSTALHQGPGGEGWQRKGEGWLEGGKGNTGLYVNRNHQVLLGTGELGGKETLGFTSTETIKAY